MKKINIDFAARVYLVWYLKDYLKDFNHSKKEEDLINKLIEQFESEGSLEMTFSDSELKLIIDSVNHAIDTLPFVPEFIIY